MAFHNNNFMCGSGQSTYSMQFFLGGGEEEHLGEFPIVSYLKVTDSTKSGVTFFVLVRGIFFLYHLKAYVYSFILTRDS